MSLKIIENVVLLKDLIGDIDVLNTHMGNILSQLIENGIRNDL